MWATIVERRGLPVFKKYRDISNYDIGKSLPDIDINKSLNFL